MSTDGGQKRSPSWQKNVIEPEMATGYFTPQRLLRRLRQMFPLVTDDSQFALDPVSQSSDARLALLTV